LTATLTATAPDEYHQRKAAMDDRPRSRPYADGGGRTAQDLLARGRRFETCRAHHPDQQRELAECLAHPVRIRI
jgi:hypothetical protein